MVHFNRRRLRGRRLAQPARTAPLPPVQLPDDRSGESTEFDVASVGAEPPRTSSHDTTVEIRSLPPLDPEAAAGPGLDAPPPPPKRLEFSCSCGTVLVATPATYDKHTRCAMCQIVMLLNVVYDPERRVHEIVPFQINPDLGP